MDEGQIRGVYEEKRKIKLKSDSHKYIADAIKFPFEITISHMRSNVIAVKKYNESGKCIGNECSFKIIDSDNEEHSVTINEIYKPDGMFDILVNFSERYNKKFPFRSINITKDTG